MANNYYDIGDTGLTRWGNQIFEEFLTNLRYPGASKVYNEMSSNDPIIGAILYMSVQLVKRAKWKVQAASDSTEDKEAADFLESCMDDMEKTMSDIMDDVLSEFTYGFSLLEIVYKHREDGRIGWKKMPIRSQDSLYGWEFYKNGDIKAFKQQAPPHYKITDIPIKKCLLFTTTSYKDNPEGKSLLRNAYRPWYFKKRIEEIEGIGIERDLAGLPVIQPPNDINLFDTTNVESNKLRAYTQTLVTNVRRDKSEGVVLPPDWEFKLLSTGGSRQFDTSAIINRYDQKIAMTMLADLVMLGQNAGSYALADVKKSLLAASLEAQLDRIASVFNKNAVKKLFEINHFPNITELPKMVHEEIETPDIKDLAFLLRASGFSVTKDLPLMNHLRELISLDPLKKEEFEEMYSSVDGENEADTFGNNKLLADEGGDMITHSIQDNEDFYDGR